ncbi:AsnC family transcriptional regulator [Bathymodiolus thermophilus thioautotrophic gill symbiont]|uniref:AsnC family transcriptional regulator n=2 Tax=Bathymodiolus thermophilus thioautotrophic gill symbiont TaxID=2360 RepID=A0A3G3IJP0_9GAMM|nr:Fic family protein [Bathymodiolus thermophilus thioautotrophic gill symbiont]AYQ56056.1 AsnC family transcriptional regulator [Bathymodiolus thermophilus thioautotrophic gill symbiont]
MDLKTLNITPELLKIIAELDEFNGGWKMQNNLDPDFLSRLRHVATIESIGSSTRIEGSKLTDNEIESLLSEVKKQSFSHRDEQEVAGYSEIMETIFTNFEHIEISENYIKQLHIILLRHSDKDIRHRGEYKKHSNGVEAFNELGKNLGVVFETTSAFDTPRKMQELIYWARESLSDKSYHPLIIIAVFNLVFLAIHPFQDGNGRLSRSLVSLLMLKAGYGYIPYSSLESIVEKNKDGYYLALQRTQKTLQSKTDWLPWLNFFFRSLKRQKDHLQTKTNNVEKYSHLPQESVIIMQYLEKHNRITIAEASNIITTISKPSVKNRLSELVKLGLVARNGKARGTWYSKKLN